MKIEALKRTFAYNAIELADPGAALTPAAVKDFYTSVYPDLTNAEIEGPKVSGSTQAQPLGSTAPTRIGTLQPHWFGGMTFDWAEEAGQKAQSDPKFKQIALTAHKLIGYTRSSDELLDDAAVSLEAFLSGNLGLSGGAAWMEDYAFLRGHGAGQCHRGHVCYSPIAAGLH